MNLSNHKKALMLASVASMIEQFNMSNIKILQSLGYDVDVVADFENPGTITLERAELLKRRLNDMGVRVIHIAIPRSLNPKSVVSAYKAVKNLINSEEYSLIHCHSPIGGAIARMAAKNRRMSGMKVIYTAHGFHFYDGAPLTNWIVYYPIEKWLSKYTDILITINREDFQRANTKFHAQKTIYVPGVGVDTEKFNAGSVNSQKIRSELGLTSDDILLLSVGELNENKNHSTVIRALADISSHNIHYCIAGKGDLKDFLQNLAAQYNVNLHLLGYRTDTPELYADADIFLLPSIREGLNVSLMEAMSSGLPCIVGDIRGNRDLIDDEGGILVDSTDVQSWHNAVLRMIENDKSSFAAHNQQKIKDFSKDAVMEMMERIYQE